jgi:predicted PurR-regulated permease PerM
LITVIIIVIVPEIRDNAVNFFVDIPENYNRLLDTIAETIGETGLISKEEMLETLSSYSVDLGEIMLDFSYLLKTIMNVTLDVVSVTLNVLMGLFISFYMLAYKERFLKQITKVMYAFLKENTATRAIHVINGINIMFRKFVLAKAVDSLIIGVIAYAGLSVMGMPLAMMLSVIIGITNMIPYFGPFIGAIPAILIVLFTDPTKTLLVAVFILALQQFDGNFLGPKLLGKSIGINPVWIIFSIIIGGAIGGPIGMFLGVPIFASLKVYFDEYVDKKYNSKFAEGSEEEKEKEPVILPRASLIEGYDETDYLT